MVISVVTAVYNGERYLAEAIESMLTQTFKFFEYIIVNDGSEDETKKILDHLTDPRVRVIHLERNGGAARALNTGISKAKGKWIALQDADDVSSKHRLQRQLQYIRSCPKVVAVGSFIRCIGGNDTVSQSEMQWEEAFFNHKQDFRLYQFYSTPLCHGSGFFLKEAFEKIGGYDPSFKIAYDYDLWTRMFEVGEISRVPEMLYQYRVHQNSLVHKNKNEATKEVLLSTFKCIAALRFKHLQRKPRLILLGLKSNFAFYRESLEPHNRYLELLWLDLNTENVTEASHLYRLRKTDGIIVVINRHLGKLVRYFEEIGLSFGVNLFMVWMPGEAG